jgi:hypothetical protein
MTTATSATSTGTVAVAGRERRSRPTSLPHLVRVELLKLRTTPGLWVTAGVVAGLVVTSVVANVLLAGRAGAPPVGSVANVDKVFSLAAVTTMALLVLGILVSASEHRYRTIVGAYLGETRRGRVLLAKLVTAGGLGAAGGAGMFGLGVATALPVYASQGVSHLPVHLTPLWLSCTAATAVFGMLGVALGELTRNTVTAAILAVLWSFVLEAEVLQAAVPSLAKWLPTGAGRGLSDPEAASLGLLHPVPAALVLLGWVSLLSLTALRLTTRREVR